MKKRKLTFKTKSKIKYCREGYPLCFVGNADQTIKVLEDYGDYIKSNNGLIGVQTPDDENDYGKPSPFGRITLTIFFTSYKYLCDCANSLEKLGYDMSGVCYCPYPVKFYMKMPIYSSYKNDENFKRMILEKQKEENEK